MSTVYSLKLKEAIFLQKSETQFKHANSTFYHLFILVFALSGVSLSARHLGLVLLGLAISTKTGFGWNS